MLPRRSLPGQNVTCSDDSVSPPKCWGIWSTNRLNQTATANKITQAGSEADGNPYPLFACTLAILYKRQEPDRTAASAQGKQLTLYTYGGLPGFGGREASLEPGLEGGPGW